jgi:hypothetical protein
VVLLIQSKFSLKKKGGGVKVSELGKGNVNKMVGRKARGEYVPNLV